MLMTLQIHLTSYYITLPYEEMYSRKEPYEGEDLKLVLQQVADPLINRRPPIPSSMPAAIQTLTTECNSGTPSKRPSFQEIHQRIQRLSENMVEPGLIITSKQVKKEKKLQMTEKLLFEVFPKHIALDLLAGRKVEPER